MALKTEFFTFVHIPKTGGSAFREHVRLNGIERKEIGDFHSVPSDVWRGITLVRHPVDWLRSFWAYRTKFDWAIKKPIIPNWDIIFDLTQWAKGTTWNEFVNNLFINDTDLVYTIYGLYRRPNIMVYKLESMNLLLRKYNMIGNDKEYHVTPNKPEITRNQRFQLERVCRYSIQEYGYVPSQEKTSKEPSEWVSVM